MDTIEYKRLATDLALTDPPTLDHKFFLWRKRQTNFLTKTTNIMSTLRNKVQLIGRLGSKVEIKNLEGGKTLGKVSLATNEYYKNQKGERVEETTWHNIVAWGKQAELLDKYTDKGSEIAIEGKLSNRSYEDKEGVKRYISEVVVQNILLMGERKANVPEEADLPF